MTSGNRYVVLGRRILLTMLGVAVLGLASDASAQVRHVSQPRVRPKLKKPLKLPSRLTVGKINAVRGHRVDLFATLLGISGRPIVGRRVVFELRDPYRNTVDDTCSARSNGYGRAHCIVSIPRIGGAADYEVRARFGGSAKARATEATGHVWVRDPAPTGRLGAGGAPRISLVNAHGAVGRRTVLRASLWKAGAPYTQGRVYFTANGLDIGSARPNAAGIARLTFTPRSSQFARLPTVTVGRTEAWDGAIQAWWVPPAGDTTGPVATVAHGRFYVANTPCGAYQRSTPPIPCSWREQRPSVFSTQRQARARVSKNSRNGGRTLTSAQIRFAMAAPPALPRNADCNPRAFDGAANFCKRPCSKIEWVEYQNNGHLYRLSRGDPSSCSAVLTAERSPATEDLRDFHDACALAAANRGLSRWNHTVTARFPYRQGAMFEFRDSHTVGSGGNWRAQSTALKDIRVTTLQIPVVVECR